MVWPISRPAPAPPRTHRHSRSEHPRADDDHVDAFSAGCALGVVGLLYAGFLVRAGADAERIALALTATAIGAALLLRCAWRKR